MSVETRNNVSIPTVPRNFATAMLQGRIIAMASALMSSLNQGMIVANSVVRECMQSKTDIVKDLVIATISSGLSSAAGQIVQGVTNIAAGAVGIAGGLVGMTGAAGEAKELRNLNEIPDAAAVQGERVAGPEIEMSELSRRPQSAEGLGAEGGRTNSNGVRSEAPSDDGKKALTAEQKEFRKKEIEGRWSTYQKFAGMLQAATYVVQGGGSLAQAPYTALAAAQQAQSQKLQALSETASSQMGSSESAVQNAQGFFGQASQISKDSLQWAIAMSQAH